jgi:hypothetical protein
MEAPRFEIGKILKLNGRLVRIEDVEPGWVYILDTGDFAFEHELEETENELYSSGIHR